MTLANDGTGIVLLIAILLWVAFIASYIAYGNRFRSPTGRSLMIVSFGYMIGLIPQLLRHPFGVSTMSSEIFTWFQIFAFSVGAVGTLSILVLMIRANGRWPWQKSSVKGKSEEPPTAGSLGGTLGSSDTKGDPDGFQDHSRS